MPISSLAGVSEKMVGFIGCRYLTGLRSVGAATLESAGAGASWPRWASKGCRRGASNTPAANSKMATTTAKMAFIERLPKNRVNAAQGRVFGKARDGWERYKRKTMERWVGGGPVVAAMRGGGRWP